jgi:ABC-type transporter Mla MlaB component
MLRITRIQGSDETQTLKLDGKLLGPWVAEVRDLCASSGCQPGRMRLDLSGLSFVDAAGAALLQDLLRQGFTVAACSGFVAELLQRENS